MQLGYLMSPAWVLSVGCALLATLYWFSTWLRMLPIMLRLPGPTALPIIGNALLVTDSKRMVYLGRNIYRLYGPLVRFWSAVLPLVLVNEPQYVQAVLSSSKNTDKSRLYSLLHNFLGQGLLTSNGESWRTHRRIIQPAFHASFMEKFVSTFASGSNALVETLKLKTQLNGGFNIAPVINDAVIGILKEAVLGIPYQPSIVSEDKSPYRKGKVTAQYRISHPWLLLNWIYEKTEIAKKELDQQSRLFEFTKNIVTERREQRKKFGVHINSTDEANNNVSFLDFMIDCLDENKTMNEHEVIHELCTFMLAGQDSVGSALVFCLHLLAQNPTAQQTVVEELDSIFQGSPRDPTIQDLRNMRFLDRCIKETLRMYPSVPLIGRKINENVIMGEYTLPAGCEVVISPFILHHLPQVWESPAQFDPDRFLPENCAKRHPYTYIPFSAGPRNCIGYKFSLLEMKTVLSTLLRKYQVLPVPGREMITLLYRMTLRASGGIWVRLVPRG